MEDLSLHILDIAENSISSGAKEIKIKISENSEKDILSLEIIDNGKGMDEETVRKVLDPFFTTRTTRRVGLGLPLLAEAARMSGGDISIKSKLGKGTKITATFQLRHIDRKPLGDMVSTLITLIAANPSLKFIYIHQKNGSKFIFDTNNYKKLIKDNFIKPETIREIKKILKNGLDNLSRR
ncbi:MAG: ATP-binding protein [Acidobacteriota bacterium]